MLIGGYILTLILRSFIMLIGGVLVHLSLEKRWYDSAGLFFALWIESIHRLIKWAAYNHVGGFNGQGGLIYNVLNCDYVNFAIGLLWFFAILNFLYFVNRK